MPLTYCLHHLPQITFSYFSSPWKKYKRLWVDVNLSNSSWNGSGILSGLNARARTPTRRVYFASIIIWREPMADFFPNRLFKGRAFSPDKPEDRSCARPQASSLHVQNSLLRVKRATDSAAAWRGALPRPQRVTCCLCDPSAASQIPSLKARKFLGLWWQGLGRKRLPVKHPQNQSKVAGGSYPKWEAGITFSFLKTTGKLSQKCIFSELQNQREKQEKKNVTYPDLPQYYILSVLLSLWFFL